MEKKMVTQKKTKKKSANNQNQNQNLQETLSSIQGKLAFLEAENQTLRQQLEQRNQQSNQQNLESEAERLRKEKEALEADADIQKLIKQSFANEPRQPQNRLFPDEEQLSMNDMVAVIAENVGKAIKANSQLTLKAVEEKLANMTSQVAGTQQAVIKMIAGMGIKEVSDEFKDFNDYREDIAKIVKRYPGMTPKDAYLLAKSQRSLASPTKNELESERPNEIPSSLGNQAYFESATPFEEEQEFDSEFEPEDNPNLSKRAQFSNAVSNAIDKVLAARSK